MVEPAQSIGAIIFAAAIAVMVISAGVASFPPARDWKVFTGAAILAGAWVAMLAAQKFFNSWTITSDFFILDFLYLIGFYFLSRPGKKSEKADWAGYIVAIFVVMIAVEFMHFLSDHSLVLERFFLGFLALASVIILIGFFRGFGLAPALCFAAVVTLVVITAFSYYEEATNVLTFMVILIIMWKGVSGAWKNISAWKKKIENRMRPHNDGGAKENDANCQQPSLKSGGGRRRQSK